MKTILTGLCLLGLTTACAHQTTTANDPQMEKMAKMHSDMAACLRANKSFDECHKEMMSACQKDCPMMQGHMQGGNMGMLMNQPKTTQPKPTDAKDDEHAGHHPKKRE